MICEDCNGTGFDAPPGSQTREAMRRQGFTDAYISQDGCSSCGGDGTIRMAKCAYCDRTEPSANRESLAFFEDLGEGSYEATNSCKNCRYHEIAHGPDGNPNSVSGRSKFVCEEFTPQGDRGQDRFYCGCRGWD
jgi:hypothetical protein